MPAARLHQSRLYLASSGLLSVHQAYAFHNTMAACLRGPCVFITQGLCSLSVCVALKALVWWWWWVAGVCVGGQVTPLPQSGMYARLTVCAYYQCGVDPTSCTTCKPTPCVASFTVPTNCSYSPLHTALRPCRCCCFEGSLMLRWALMPRTSEFGLLSTIGSSAGDVVPQV